MQKRNIINNWVNNSFDNVIVALQHALWVKEDEGETCIELNNKIIEVNKLKENVKKIIYQK